MLLQLETFLPKCWLCTPDFTFWNINDCYVRTIADGSYHSHLVNSRIEACDLLVIVKLTSRSKPIANFIFDSFSSMKYCLNLNLFIQVPISVRPLKTFICFICIYFLLFLLFRLLCWLHQRNFERYLWCGLIQRKTAWYHRIPIPFQTDVSARAAQMLSFHDCLNQEALKVVFTSVESIKHFF